ncbi:uncharacterized protein LOC120697933 [Panicum virgatum]|uniref:uncharacterized protein LOC120697933 n=1 Tax=Panicum virgatum TaxID=38727 RepID=UPI0019D58218|nr:uncharacterized protein LOC120697933 [Panicum virgatum]
MKSSAFFLLRIRGRKILNLPWLLTNFHLKKYSETRMHSMYRLIRWLRCLFIAPCCRAGKEDRRGSSSRARGLVAETVDLYNACPLRTGRGEDAAAAAAEHPPGPPHPYLTTHGGKVARLHLVDWVVLALLVAVDVGLNLVEPFHRYTRSSGRSSSSSGST